MRIAWIDHVLSALGRKAFEARMKIEYDLELVSESSLERFEKKHGYVESYDGLLIHSGIQNQTRDIKRIRELQIPIALISCSPNHYDNQDITVLSYNHPEDIAKFFLERKK